MNTEGTPMDNLKITRRAPTDASKTAPKPDLPTHVGSTLHQQPARKGPVEEVVTEHASGLIQVSYN